MSGVELQSAHDFGDVTDGSGAVFHRTRLEDSDGDAASAGDWRDYCFELSADRMVGLGLRQLDRDADLVLLSDGGDELASGRTAGTASEWVEASLRAGDYCARVTATEAGQNHFVFRYGTGPADADSLLPETESAASPEIELSVELVPEEVELAPVAVELTAEFSEFPDAHDGSAFTAVLSFDPEPEVGYRTLRDEALTATGATITSASRQAAGRNDRWLVTITPDSGHRGNVDVVLAATTSCDDQGAICTAGGEPLITRVELRVPGPDSTQQHANQITIRSVVVPPPQDNDKDKDDDYPTMRQVMDNDATLSDLRVDGTQVIGFGAPLRRDFYIGVASSVSQVTVAATPSHAGATVAITPADADPRTAGHQVGPLSGGQNAVTITVTAVDSTTLTYTVSVNRGVTTAFGWKVVDDFDTLTAAGNTAPEGVWSNGATIWVVNSDPAKIFAYNLASKARDSAKDFNTLSAAGNDLPGGIWSDGTTMWVTDTLDRKIYAYNLSTKARDSAKDFDTLDAADRPTPGAIWSDGTTMWVTDTVDARIYAYNLSSKARDDTKDFDTLSAAGNDVPWGIWSDGTTMWVTDIGEDKIDDKIYAYNLASKARDADKDFNTLRAAGNVDARDIWSDGVTMWVVDQGDRKLYSYNLLVAAPVGLSVTAGAGQAELSWDNPGDSSISGYEYRHRAAGASSWGPGTGEGWTAVPSSDDSTTSYTVTGLVARTEYTLEVRARNTVGPGAAARVEMTRPAEPSGLRGIPGDARVALDWNNPNDAAITGYEYRVSIDDGGTWNPDWTAISGSGATTTSYTVTGLTNGTPYTFQVRAVNPAGGGDAAQVDATPSLLPAAPLGLTADNGMDSEAELIWDNPDNPSITGYEYRVSDDGGATWREDMMDEVWMAVPSSDDLTTSYTVTGLANKVEQLIELRAVNGNGDGPAAAEYVTPLGELADARDNILLESDGLDDPPSTLTVPDSGVRWASQAFETGSHPLGYRFEEASVYLSGVDRDDRVSMAIYDDDGNGRPGRRLYKMYPRYCCQNMNPLGRARTSDDRSRDDAFDEDGVADYFVSRTDPDTRAIITPYLDPDTTYHIVIDTTAGTVNVGRRPDTDTTGETDHGWTLGGHATSTNGRTWTPAAGGERLAIDVRGAPIGSSMPPIPVGGPTTATVPHDAPIGHRVATVRFSPGVSGFTVETSLKEPDERCLGRITGTDPDTGNATRAPAKPSVCLFTVESGDQGTTATIKLNHQLNCNRTRYTIVIRAHYSKDKNAAPKDHSITMTLTGC